MSAMIWFFWFWLIVMFPSPFSSAIRINHSFSDRIIFDWIGPLRKPPRKPPDPFRFRNLLLRQVRNMVDCWVIRLLDLHCHCHASIIVESPPPPFIFSLRAMLAAQQSPQHQWTVNYLRKGELHAFRHCKQKITSTRSPAIVTVSASFHSLRGSMIVLLDFSVDGGIHLEIRKQGRKQRVLDAREKEITSTHKNIIQPDKNANHPYYNLNHNQRCDWPLPDLSLYWLSNFLCQPNPFNFIPNLPILCHHTKMLTPKYPLPLVDHHLLNSHPHYYQIQNPTPQLQQNHNDLLQQHGYSLNGLRMHVSMKHIHHRPLNCQPTPPPNDAVHPR